MNINEHLPDGLLDKLNKLKNLEDGARSVGSHEEAANAAGKYQALLLKYNLDEETVLEHGVKQKAQMLCSDFDPRDYELMNSTDWVERLMKVVAKHCICEVVRHSYTKTFSILGEKHNVAIAFYLVEQLAGKIMNAMIISYAKYKRDKGAESKSKYCKGFMVGAVLAIQEKLYEELKTAKQTEPGMEVMIINKSALVTKFMLDKYPNLRFTRNPGLQTNSNDGFDAGSAAGRSMSFNKGVSGARGAGQRKIE